MIRCAATACEARIPNRDALCRAHWSRMPESWRASFITARHTGNQKAMDVCLMYVADILSDNTPTPKPQQPAVPTRKLLELVEANR